MNILQMFVIAAKKKVRFKSEKGQVALEDLWDLSLNELDAMARALNKEVQEAGEVSFIEEKPKAASLVELRFELVKFVIADRLDTRDKARIAAANKERIARIESILAERQDDKLKTATDADLLKELEELKK